MMKLYGYWRSIAAYRVRIACQLKGLTFESVAVDLCKEGGAQSSPSYSMINPNKLVPTLVDGDRILNQSLAIIEYLDEAYPERPLLPERPFDRAQVRALAYNLAMDCNPLNTERVGRYLEKEAKLSVTAIQEWTSYWLMQAFNGFELQIQHCAGHFCFGDQITLADLCLVPTYDDALRRGLDLSPFKRIADIVRHCHQIEAFNLARPECQTDAKNER